MLSLDLFTSRFETRLHEGAVDSIVGSEKDQPQEKIPTNINQFNTDDNRALVKRIWAQISQQAINDTAGWLTLEWPNQPAATLSRNQVWTVINKIAKMPATQRNAFALSTLGDRNAFLTWMNSLKIIPRPAPKKEPTRGQQSFDLKEAEKKSSDDTKFKSTRLDRLKTQARARHPAAASDMEAMVADFVDQQDQDQTEFNRVKDVNRRQDELLKQITDLNQTQDQEIDNLGSEEGRLQQNIKQIQAANATLAQKLATMSQRRVKAEPTPEPQPQLGVSVATDKVPADTVPALSTTPAIDPRARQYAQALRKQLNQLQTMVALKAPEDQSQLKQDIDSLKAQLAKLQQQEPVVTATPATVGGQAADIMPARSSADDESDDNFLDLTGVDDVLAQFRQPAKKSAKKKTKKQPEFELTEADTIPVKSVIQGYTVDYSPNTGRVTVSRGGRIIGAGTNKGGNPKYHSTLINRIIDSEEDDKYPMDIDDRDVALPMKKVSQPMKAKELQESGPETWTVYFTDGTKTRVRVPSDETTPTQVRAHFAKKGKTVDRFDYTSVEPNTGSKPEPHEPGSGTAVSARTGDQLPESALDRSGQKMYQAQEVYMLTHDGQQVAFYKLKDLKRAEQDAQEMQKQLGGEVHLRKVMRESGTDTFNRGGNNKLRDKNDYYDKREYLAKQLDTPGYSYADRQLIRDRMMQLEKAARMQGFVK